MGPWDVKGAPTRRDSAKPERASRIHQMAQVISNLKREFDVVILDTPPLLAVSDAAVLASQADGAVVVVRHGKSSKNTVAIRSHRWSRSTRRSSARSSMPYRSNVAVDTGTDTPMDMGMLRPPRIAKSRQISRGRRWTHYLRGVRS